MMKIAENVGLIAALTVVALLPAAVPAFAAPPPDRMNYQGVLRDAADEPLDGAYDMVFRFWSAENAGDEILVDRHLAVDGNAVSVTGGLFSVQLGSGQVLDGSGPGTYTSLAQVFADYGDVWLEIQIESETLVPRIAVASAGYALNAGRLDGRPAGSFLDTSSLAQTKAGRLAVDASGQGTYGVEGYGDVAGGYFTDADNSGYAEVGVGNRGIQAYGTEMGGYFKDSDQSAYANVAFANRGIEAFGTTMGGRFEDSDGSGYSEVGINNDGIRAYGNAKGGYFADLNGSGYANVGTGQRGIEGFGNEMGGYFADANGSGYANVGVGQRGIEGFGNEMGGYFADSDDSGYAWVGNGDYGILGYGLFTGGYFADLDGSGNGYVGRGGYGVLGFGNTAGGRFEDGDEGTYLYAARGASSTSGNGAKNFIQNHPYDPSRKIVYTALEGNEAGTYTRGSGRLVGGTAQIALDETFAWVTNPDIGLTVQLTPHGRSCVLFVEDLGTAALAVGSDDPACSDVAFDYIVHGLRIGFEEIPVVQPKEDGEQAPIPSMISHRELLTREPELRATTPLERFRAIAAEVGGIDASSIDLSRAQALVAAIHEFDPAVDSVEQIEPMPRAEEAERTLGTGPAAGSEAERTAAGAAVVSAAAPVVVATTSEEPVAEPSELPAGAVLMDISGAASPGDLLTLDPNRPGALRVADAMADPGVVGVAIGSIDSATASAPVLTFGIAEVRVDATYGAIRLGDLLVSSPTPGHAMSALETLPGTIIGKALETLESGTGTIDVLLMPR